MARRKLKHGTRDYAKPAKDVSVAKPRWDHGATGQANQIGLVVEERGEKDPVTGKTQNPNGVTGARRIDTLDLYHRRGWISDRGYTAGEALRDAWSQTQRSKGVDLSDVRVDQTRKPDANIDIKIDRISRYHAIARLIAIEDKRILDTVVSEGHAIGRLPEYRAMNHDKGIAHLRSALERLADAMRC